MKKIKLAVFASGNGSNAQNIVEYFIDSSVIEVALIVTNNENAFVIERSKKMNIPFEIISKSKLNDSFFTTSILVEYQIDWIILAGFLLKIPEYIISMFPNRILNIHPALLPKYGGKGMYGNFVHQAVKENGEPYTGITIHLVNENFDEGTILFQAVCEISQDDSIEVIANKVHELEFRYFPEIIKKTIC